jgi:hypothetical protein
MEDEDSAQTHFNFVFAKVKEYKQYVLSIYIKSMVINELKDKLIVYGNLASEEKENKRDTYKLLGGQKKHDKNFDDKVILIGAEVGNKIRICGVNSVVDFATPIPIGGIGSSSSRIIVDREFEGKMDSIFTIVSVEISLMKMSPNCDVFSKKITLRSKGIIANSTKRKIVLKEEYATRFQTILPAGSRRPSVFGLPEIKDKMHTGYYAECEGFRRSVVFHIPEEGYAYFKLHGAKDKGAEDY